MFRIAKYNNIISTQNVTDYFEKMAQKGYMISVISDLYYCFAKIERSELKFEVIVNDKNILPLEILIEKSKDKGWRYVCDNEYIVVFCKEKNCDAAKIIDDDKLEYQMIKNIGRKKLIPTCVLVILAVIYSLAMIFIDVSYLTTGVILNIPLLLGSSIYLIKVAIWFRINEANIERKKLIFRYNQTVDNLSSYLIGTLVVTWMLMNISRMVSSNLFFSTSYLISFIYLGIFTAPLVLYFNFVLMSSKKSFGLKLLLLVPMLFTMIILGLAGLVFLPKIVSNSY